MIRRPFEALVLLFVTLGAMALPGCARTVEPADLVLLGGKIVTLEDAPATVEALASLDGVLVALGTDDEIRRLVGPDTRAL